MKWLLSVFLKLVVAWDDFEGDREFYVEQGFSPYQTYHFAKRSLDKPIPEIEIPSGIEVYHHPMETKEERIKYTEVENQY